MYHNKPNCVLYILVQWSTSTTRRKWSRSMSLRAIQRCSNATFRRSSPTLSKLKRGWAARAVYFCRQIILVVYKFDKCGQYVRNGVQCLGCMNPFPAFLFNAFFTLWFWVCLKWEMRWVCKCVYFCSYMFFTLWFCSRQPILRCWHSDGVCDSRKCRNIEVLNSVLRGGLCAGWVMDWWTGNGSASGW